MTARILLIAALLLSLNWMPARAGDLRERTLPDGRFRDWETVQQRCTDTMITQVWRKALTNLPREADGYLMVVYQVEQAPTAAEAANRALALTRRERFKDYAARGYAVTADAWIVRDTHGVLFTVSGLNHDTESLRAHRAEIYTFATAIDTWTILLEVRQSVTVPDLDQTERALKNAGGHELADTLVGVLQEVWRVANPANTAPAKPADPPKPAATPAPTDPPKPADPLKPADPPKPVDPPKPTDPPKLAETPTGPPRWRTADQHLAMTVPADWKPAGANPVIFTGPNGSEARLYNPEAFVTAPERTQAMQDYAASQRDISLKRFTQRPFDVDGATGVQVRYTSHAKTTVYGYYFGKSGRLWRFELELAGENTALPEALQQWVAGITVE